MPTNGFWRTGGFPFLSVSAILMQLFHRQSLWFASLDLTKAFDRIEYSPLFDALLQQGVPRSYCTLLWKLYKGQTGSVHGSERFTIERGVKQGDVISPILFNAGLEHAMRKWQAKLFHHGVQLGHGNRLTNIRYADDLMLLFFFFPLLFGPQKSLAWTVLLGSLQACGRKGLAISIPVAPALQGRWPSPSQSSLTRGWEAAGLGGWASCCLPLLQKIWFICWKLWFRSLQLAACNWIRPKQKFWQRLRWTLLSLLMYVEKWYK